MSGRAGGPHSERQSLAAAIASQTANGPGAGAGASARSVRAAVDDNALEATLLGAGSVLSSISKEKDDSSRQFDAKQKTERIGDLSRLLEKMLNIRAFLRLLEQLIDGGESSAADGGACAAGGVAGSEAQALEGTVWEDAGARMVCRAAGGARAEAGDSAGELVARGTW